MTSGKKSGVSGHIYDLVNQENKTKEENDKIPAPDGGYGWVVLFGSFLISVILDGIMYSFSMIKNPIKNFYVEPEEKVNLIFSFNSGLLFCSGPIVAGLVNQFGCRIVVMAGAIVTSLMYFLTAFAPSIEVIIVTYGIVGGISTGCTYIASLIVVADYFEKKKGIATGITMAGSGVGQLFIAPFIEYLIERFKWKITMSICSCIILLTFLCGALLKPLNPSESSNSKNLTLKSKEYQDENVNVSKTIQTYIGSTLSLNEIHKTDECQRNKFLRITIDILKEMTDFKLLWENVLFLLITVSNFFVFAGQFITFIYLTKIAEENGIKNSAWLISIIGIVNIPCRILFGLIADKKYILSINLNTLSVFISTISLFLYPLLQYCFLSQAVFAFIFAVGIAGINSLTTKYLVDIAGMEKFKNSNGIVNLVRGFGCFIGPFLAGLISKKYSDVATFYYSGVCLLIGFGFSVSVSVIMLYKKKNEKSNQTQNSNESEKYLIENKVQV